MVWGIGVLALLGGLTWLFRQPSTGAPLGRAFGVLVFYGVLFLLTLVKIWWTAVRSPAVVLDEETLGYQPLHTFRRRTIPLAGIRSCAMKPGTQSLGFVYRPSPDRERQFFLNLAVVDRRNEFLHELAGKLAPNGVAIER